MPITRIGEATVDSGGSSTDLTTAMPGGVTTGDLLILEVGTSTGPYTLTNNGSGWTWLRRTGDAGSAPAEAALEIWWKAAGASNPAPTLTSSGATRWHTCIRALRGANTTAPFLTENAAIESGGSGTTVHTAPALTNVDANAWGLFTLVARQVPSPHTATPGAGLTQRVDQESGVAGTANLLYFAADSNGAVPTGTVTGSATGSSGSAIAVMWAALVRPTGSTSVTGVTATVDATADAGTVTGGASDPVDVTGVTALVVVQGGEVAVAGSVAPPGTWPPDPYRRAIRGSITTYYTVDASLLGVPVAGATGMRPVAGSSVTDTTKPGVRRTLSLTLAPQPGLFNLLAPVGTTLTVTGHVVYTDRTTQTLPMGVFDVDSQSMSEGGGSISLTAPDRWVQIQRARFVGPDASTPGVLVTTQISALIRTALGATEPVNVLSTSTATVGWMVWEKDRDKAIIDLAKSIGAWVFFDRDGVATIADIPTAGAAADWLVDASTAGVLTELDRERSRATAYNVVVVSSSATEGELFPAQYVWDDSIGSPTYAGTDPRTAPQTAGPFGIVTYYFDTPIIDNIPDARTAGRTILARTTGLASQVSLGQIPNPAVDAFHVLDVLPPQERYDIPRVIERHIVDTVTHFLSVGTAQHIEARSTRTDEIVGGS